MNYVLRPKDNSITNEGDFKTESTLEEFQDSQPSQDKKKTNHFGSASKSIATCVLNVPLHRCKRGS
jgi:hypothetical protein